MAVVNLRQAGAAAGTDASALVAVGQGLVAVRDETFLVAPGVMPGLNALLLGYVLSGRDSCPVPSPRWASSEPYRSSSSRRLDRRPERNRRPSCPALRSSRSSSGSCHSAVADLQGLPAHGGGCACADKSADVELGDGLPVPDRGVPRRRVRVTATGSGGNSPAAAGHAYGLGASPCPRPVERRAGRPEAIRSRRPIRDAAREDGWSSVGPASVAIIRVLRGRREPHHAHGDERLGRGRASMVAQLAGTTGCAGRAEGRSTCGPRSGRGGRGAGSALGALVCAERPLRQLGGSALWSDGRCCARATWQRTPQVAVQVGPPGLPRGAGEPADCPSPIAPSRRRRWRCGPRSTRWAGYVPIIRSLVEPREARRAEVAVERQRSRRRSRRMTAKLVASTNE